jgi:hypothetical protein
MRRNAKLTEVKRLIMENLPSRNDQVGVTRASLLNYCVQDGVSLQLLVEPPLFEQALSSLVSEQNVVYFSSEDVRPTYKGVNNYNKWS